MTPKQIVLVTLVAAGFIILILELIRRHMMREKYSLLWFFLALAALSVPVLYDLYARLARLLGIIEVANFFFFMAIVFLFLMCLQFTLAISSAYRRAKTLIQEVALLENRLVDLERRAKGSEADGAAAEGSGEHPSPPEAPGPVA